MIFFFKLYSKSLLRSTKNTAHPEINDKVFNLKTPEFRNVLGEAVVGNFMCRKWFWLQAAIQENNLIMNIYNLPLWYSIASKSVFPYLFAFPLIEVQYIFVTLTLNVIHNWMWPQQFLFQNHWFRVSSIVSTSDSVIDNRSL